MMSTPIFPKVGTMQSRALALLLQGETITHRDILSYTASYRLSSPICALRDKGWKILNTWEVVPTSDPTKRSTHIKRYFLMQAAISLAGAYGRNYVRKVREWEKMRMAGKGTTNLANKKAARTLAQGTSQEEHSTGCAI